MKVHKSIHFHKENFTRNTLVMSNFDQNSQFLRKTQKTRFLPLFVRNWLKIDKNSKNKFRIAFWTQNTLLDVAISHFCDFLLIFFSFIPNKAKKSTFYQIFKFLTLFGM